MSEWKQTEIGLMPTNWQEYTIDDLIENIIDNRGKTPPPATSGYKLIETYQVSVDKIFPMYDDTQQKYVSEATYKTWFRSGHPQQDDILFTTVGEKVPQFCLVDKTLICIAQNLIALRVNKKIVNPLYLLNYFRQEKFIKQVKNILLTTAQPSVKVPHLLALRIYLPSTDYQDKISHLLSCLDNKIDNLRRQNETLEEIAQTLFKHWFIDFEFPNDDGKPYKSSGGAMVASELGDIPEGWCVGTIGEIMTLNYGKSLITDNRVNGQYLVVGSSGVVGTHNEYLVKAPGIVIGRKGTIGKVIWLENNFYPIDTTFFVTEKLGCNDLYFHYFILKNQQFERLISDSAVPGLNRDMAYSVEIIISNLSLINNFSSLARSLFNKKANNENQIKTLTKTRDTLLPKLMSGQIRIKEGESVIEEEK